MKTLLLFLLLSSCSYTTSSTWVFTQDASSLPDSSFAPQEDVRQEPLELNDQRFRPQTIRDSSIRDTSLFFGDATFTLPTPPDPITEPCRYWIIDNTYSLHQMTCTRGIGTLSTVILTTVDGYLFPDVVQEFQVRDSFTAWVITTTALWAVGLEDGIAVRSRELRRADWAASYWDPNLEALVLIDSAGEITSWTEADGLRTLATLDFDRTSYLVHGDAVMNEMTNEPAIILRGLEGTRLFSFDPLSGHTNPYPEAMVLDAKGLAYSANYFWATNNGLAARVDPLTGHCTVIHIVSDSGNFASSVRE